MAKRKTVTETQSGLSFFANPYGNCQGFYFSDLAEYKKKYAANKKKYRCEEYGIEFIDGTAQERDLFKVIAGKINAFHAVEFLTETAPGMREDELAAVYYAIEDQGMDNLEEAITWAEDEGRPREGTVKDYAENWVEDVGYPEGDNYYDYEALGQALSSEWDESEQGPEPEDMTEYAEQLVDDIGGWKHVNNPTQYFDMDAFARDLELGGDVTEFEFGGSTWTISN